MSERAFIVHLNIDEGVDLESLAEDIEEDLLSAGHDVESVEVWASPASTIMGAVPPITPIQPQQPPSLF